MAPILLLRRSSFWKGNGFLPFEFSWFPSFEGKQWKQLEDWQVESPLRLADWPAHWHVRLRVRLRVRRWVQPRVQPHTLGEMHQWDSSERLQCAPLKSQNI